MDTDEALTLIARHFSEDIPVFEESVIAQLSFAKMLYLRASSKTNLSMNVVPESMMSLLERRGLGGSMTFNGTHISFQGETVLINGKKQKTRVSDLQQLENALRKGYWIAVKRCLADIMIKKQKKLLRAGNIEEAKKQALDLSLPSELRNELLGVIAESKDSTIINWVLAQPSFADDKKDSLIHRLVDEELRHNNTVEAEKLIKKHLKSGYNAQESASKKLFYHYFNRNELASAENVVKNHFIKGYNSYETLIGILFDHYFEKEDIMAVERILTKHYLQGYNSYEQLAKRVFNYYLNQNKINQAEQWLKNHYTQGYNSFDELVEELVDYLLERKKYTEARDVVNRNMIKGYNSHTKLNTYILEQQVAFLEKQR